MLDYADEVIALSLDYTTPVFKKLNLLLSNCNEKKSGAINTKNYSPKIVTVQILFCIESYCVLNLPLDFTLMQFKI